MNNKSYCYNCKNETNNEKVFETGEFLTQNVLKRNEIGDDCQDLYTIQYHKIIIYKCLGCEHLHIEHRYKNLEQKELIVVDPSKKEFKIEEFVKELPIQYFKRIVEVNQALNKEMYWLASFGIRTVLDQYITDIVGDIGGFDKKINEMKNQGYITEKQKEVLSVVIDAGNASAHRGYEPNKEIMKQIMQIVYNIFENSILDRKAINIEKEIPKRNKKKNKE